MTHNHANHYHGHSHGHSAAGYGRAFAIGIALNISFVVAEFVYGVLANSLALLSDAGHNLSDVFGLILAWGASGLARRGPSERFTYGLRSSSILAALTNAIVLLVVTGGIVWEAIQRFSEPAPVAGATVIWVALLGVVINASSALLFMSGRKGDLNIRGAFLHLAADAAVSLGVAMAGVAILFTGWLWLDPAVSLIVAAVIVAGTWGLLRDSVNLALQSVPEGIEPQQVRDHLGQLPGVTEVHDLHIWGMSTTETALTAHLVMPGGYPGDAFMRKVAQELHDRFHIEHATLQMETGDPGHPCELAPDHVI